MVQVTEERAPARTAWCANCRKTFPHVEQVAGCCETPVPALRGEYPVQVGQVLDLHSKQRPCGSCRAPIAWIRSSSGAKVPLSMKTPRSVACRPCGDRPRPCPFCGGVGRHYLVLAHFVDCPHADKHRRRR